MAENVIDLFTRTDELLRELINIEQQNQQLISQGLELQAQNQQILYGLGEQLEALTGVEIPEIREIPEIDFRGLNRTPRVIFDRETKEWYKQLPMFLFQYRGVCTGGESNEEQYWAGYSEHLDLNTFIEFGVDNGVITQDLANKISFVCFLPVSVVGDENVIVDGWAGALGGNTVIRIYKGYQGILFDLAVTRYGYKMDFDITDKHFWFGLNDVLAIFSDNDNPADVGFYINFKGIPFEKLTENQVLELLDYNL